MNKKNDNVVQDNNTQVNNGTGKYTLSNLFEGCGKIDPLAEGFSKAINEEAIDLLGNFSIEPCKPAVSIVEQIRAIQEHWENIRKINEQTSKNFYAAVQKLYNVGKWYKVSESFEKLKTMWAMPSSYVDPLKEIRLRLQEQQSTFKHFVPGFADETINTANGDVVFKVNEPLLPKENVEEYQLPAKKDETRLAVVCKKNCDRVIDELCAKGFDTHKPAKLTITQTVDFYQGDKHFVQSVAVSSSLVEVDDGEDIHSCSEPLVYKLSGMEFAKKHNLKSISTIYGEDLTKIAQRVEEERHFYWKKKSELKAKYKNHKQKTLMEGLLRNDEQWIMNNPMSYEAFIDLTEDNDITPQDFSDAWKKYNFTANTERISAK